MIPFYVQILVAIPFFIVSGYFAKSGLNIVFGEKRDGLQVIQSGVFSLVRHPVYLGSILLFFGFVVFSLSIVAMVILGIGATLPSALNGRTDLFFSLFTYLGSYILLTFIYSPEVLGIEQNIGLWFKRHKQLLILFVYAAIVLLYIFGFG